MDDTSSHLLRAVLDEPDEDLHRLAYADWLEEHGDEAGRDYAEFIRVQCELARRPDAPFTAAEALQARASALCADAHDGLDWLWPGPLFPLMERFHPRLWWRGFLSAVTCRVSDWLEHGALLVAHQPVRVATLKPDEPYFTLRAVATYDRTPRRHLIALLRDQAVCRLHTLGLSDLLIDPVDWERALTEAYRPWRGLKRLVFPWDGFPPATRPVTSGDQRRQRAVEATRKALPGVEVVGPPPAPQPQEA